MSNNSGIPQTIVNTLERALSTSVNQTQFGSSFMQAQARLYESNAIYHFGVGSLAAARGVAFLTANNETPLAADVFGGLKVRVASSYLLVSPGVLGAHMITTSYNALNDSEYVIVNDAGVTSSTQLLFVANGSASLRVDIIECGVTEVETTESRDIYDPSTGLFSPALVPVTRKCVLTYRIRQGVAGSGYPGNLAGWLPLAIAIHHGNSVTFADVDFYDVRPLTQGRRDSGGAEYRGTAFSVGNFVDYAIPVAGGTMTGCFDMAANVRDSTTLQGGPWRATGLLTRTIPAVGQSAETFDLLVTAGANPYYCVGTSGTLSSRWMYVLEFEPFGLPRWSKYSTAVSTTTGEREPMENWGLYAIADSVAIASVINDGRLVSAVMPAGYGLGNAVTLAQVVAVYRQNGLSSALTCVHRRDGLVQSAYPSGYLTTNGTSVSGASPQTTVYTLSDLPYDISGFRARIQCEIAPGAQVEQCYMDVVLKVGASAVTTPVRFTYGFLGNSFTVTLAGNVEFPLPWRLPSGTITVEATVTCIGSGSISFNLFNSVLMIDGIWVGV